MASTPLPVLTNLDIDAFFNTDQQPFYDQHLHSPPPLIRIMGPDTNVEEWRGKDVYRWLSELCSAHNKTDEYVGNFTNITGSQLLRMSKQQFQSMDPYNGSFFFGQICSYIQERNQKDTTYSSAAQFPKEDPYYYGNSPPVYTTLEPRGANASAASIYCPSESWNSHYLPVHSNDLQPSISSDLELNLALCGLDPIEDLPQIPYEELTEELHEFKEEPQSPVSPYEMPYRFPLENHASCPNPFDHMEVPTQNPPNRDNRSVRSPRRNRERGPKLYEFLWDLLNDSSTNPSIIRWECEQELAFRLVDPNEVSRRWGERRPNTKGKALPYEHFARAMRYYYSKGILVSVPEKKLVCKFGVDVYQRLCGSRHAI